MKEKDGKSKIVMHTAKSKWDILRSGEWTYIVRNDLDISYYMKLHGLNDSNPEVGTLWTGLTGGLHYVGYNPNDHFKYAIDGKQYWRVSNIKKGPISIKRDLHPDYQNRDHYFERSDCWYGVDVDNGKYWTNTEGFSKKATEKSMRSDIKDLNPIAMWANGDYYYILTMDANDNPVVKRTNNILKITPWRDQYLSAAMISFLPGGVSNLHGSVKAEWVRVDGYSNHGSDDPIPHTFARKYTKGYDSTTTQSLEQNWKISTTQKTEASAGVGADTLKQSMSLTAEYGGAEINTKESAWSVSIEDSSTTNIEIPGRQRADLFQAVVSNGNLGHVLYSSSYTTTYNSSELEPKYPTIDAKKQFLNSLKKL